MIARLRRSYRRMRLGTRLALGLGALALIVFAVVGTALTTYMREYLSGQLDTQIAQAQIAQSKNVADTGTLLGKKYWSWFYAVYDIKDGEPKLRKPEDPTDLPHDISGFTALAKAQGGSAEELLRTEHIEDAGDYRLRACEVAPGVVLISAAPLDDIDDTVQRLVKIQVVAFGFALLVLVVIGRRLLRRGLTPLSDMAHTAHNIASHDLTDSASRLPLRADKRGGGPEVEELRTAFNTMLEHIDDSLAVRAEAEQRLRRFVADASHELRTPLAINRTLLEVHLSDPNAPVELQQLGKTLLATNERSEQLVEGLLLLARSDNQIVERKPVDLAEVAGQAIDQVHGEAETKGVVIRGERQKAVVQGNGVLLERIALNLVQNAVRYNVPEDGWVEVTTEVQHGQAVLVVSNTGPVVPAYEIDNLFEPFRRLRTERTGSDKGVGLGLSIVRSVARAHGGHITAQPREGGGLVMRVTLPL